LDDLSEASLDAPEDFKLELSPLGSAALELSTLPRTPCPTAAKCKLEFDQLYTTDFASSDMEFTSVASLNPDQSDSDFDKQSLAKPKVVYSDSSDGESYQVEQNLIPNDVVDLKQIPKELIVELCKKWPVDGDERLALHRSLFSKFPNCFPCGVCDRPRRSDGATKHTLQLKCPACKSKVSFTKVAADVVNRFNDANNFIGPEKRDAPFSPRSASSPVIIRAKNIKAAPLLMPSPGSPAKKGWKLQYVPPVAVKAPSAPAPQVRPLPAFIPKPSDEELAKLKKVVEDLKLKAPIVVELPAKPVSKSEVIQKDVSVPTVAPPLQCSGEAEAVPEPKARPEPAQLPYWSDPSTDIDQWSERPIDLGSINVPLGPLASCDTDLDLMALCDQIALEAAEVAALTHSTEDPIDMRQTAIEVRLARLEEGQARNNALLQEILAKLTGQENKERTNNEQRAPKAPTPKAIQTKAAASKAAPQEHQPMPAAPATVVKPAYAIAAKVKPQWEETKRPARVKPSANVPQVAETRTQPTPKPSNANRKPLTDGELQRVLAGLSSKPARPITAVYTVGMRANRLSMIKRILAGNCGLSLSQIPNISFIGKAIGEFHVYVDYVETFKEKVQQTLPSVSFVDLDPLDPDLIKDDSVLDKIKAAGQKLLARLQKRKEESPIPSHRRFLGEEIERARSQIASGKYNPRSRLIDFDEVPETGASADGMDEITPEDLLA
jgi:hypothetical protein